MEPLISIVDDDEPVREALRRVLAAHGLETAVFASGKQLLASDRLPEMACLIADVKMPEMSGLALHHRLMAARRLRKGFCRMCRSRSAKKPCSTMCAWHWREGLPGIAMR